MPAKGWHMPQVMHTPSRHVEKGLALQDYYHTNKLNFSFFKRIHVVLENVCNWTQIAFDNAKCSIKVLNVKLT